MSNGLTWRDDVRQLRDLVPWPRNPRDIDTVQAERLRESLVEFDQPLPIAIGPDGEVYDGHQRLKAWIEERGPNFEVAVRVSSRALTEKEREKLTVMLHKGAVGDWDWEALREWDAGELVEWGFSEEELGEWFEGDGGEAADDPGPQIDRAGELLEKWAVERGQVWQVGRHRIMCGDSTSEEDVGRLMGGEMAALVIADPPYGVSYADKNKFLNALDEGNRVQTPIEGDYGDKAQIQGMWESAFRETEKVMSAGAVIYCFMPQGGDQMMMMMMMMMSGSGIEPRHELIWLKNNHVLGRVDYAYKHEPILYAWKAGGHKFYGDFQTSILEFDRPVSSELHPTTKPVLLICRLMENSSKTSENVYDPFLGSGTTFVACEQTGRIGYGMEISPAYVAVSLERLAAMGLEAQLVEQ